MLRNHSYRAAWIFVIAVTVLVIGIQGLRQPVGEWVIERSIRNWISEAMGVDWTARSFTHEDGRLVVRGLSVGADGLESSGYQIEIESLTFDYTVNLSAGTFDAQVDVINPVVTAWIRDNQPLPPLGSGSGESLLEFQGGVTLRGGQLLLRRQSVDSDLLQRWHIEGEAIREGWWSGQLGLTSAAHETVGERIDVAFMQQTDRSSAQIDVQALQCATFANFLAFRFGDPIDAPEIEAGEMYGQLIAVLPKESRPYIEGELEVKGLEFEHPMWLLRGRVDRGRLRLNELVGFQGEAVDAPLGELEVLEGGHLALVRDELTEWEVRDLVGGISIHASGPSKVQLTGLCRHEEDQAKLEILGEALLLDPFRAFADLGVRLESPGRPAVEVALRAERMDARTKRWSLSCEQMARPEFEVFRSSVGRLLGPLHDISMRSGRFNGAVTIDVIDGRIGPVRIDDVVARDLVLEWPALELSTQVKNLTGMFRADLRRTDLFASVDAELRLGGAKILFPAPDGTPQVLDDIASELTVEDGSFRASRATARLGDLQAVLDMDWEGSEDIASLTVQGKIADFTSFLPPRVQERMRGKIDQKTLRLGGGLRRVADGLMLHGALMSDEADGPLGLVRFGCNLDAVPRALWQGVPARAHALRRKIPAWVSELTPSALKANGRLAQRQLDIELGWLGLVPRRGWFFGENLDLSEWVGPLLFSPKSRLQLTGEADFEGHFNGFQWRIDYGGRNVRLQNDVLDTRVASIGSVDDQLAGTRFPAMHYFDLKDMEHFGWLPVHDLSYLEKKSQIPFERAEANLILGRRRLHAVNLHAYAEGVYIAGTLDVVDSENGPLLVEAKSEELSGTTQQVKVLLARVDDAFMTSLPLDGLVTSGREQGYLRIEAEQGKAHIRAFVKGALKDGSYTSLDGAISVTGLGGTFDYDLESNRLRFHDLKGNALVGAGEDADGYTIVARQLEMSQFPHTELLFDLRLEDSLHDYMRLTGSGRSRPEERTVELVLDPEHTHIGSIQPMLTHLLLKDWQEVVELRATPRLRLSSLSDDFLRLSRTNWVQFGPEEIDFMHRCDLDGEIQAVLEYQPERRRWIFTAQGQDLSTMGRRFNDVELSASVSGGVWTIDELQLDELSIAADLERQTDRWRLGFLGLRYGPTLLLGLEGDYSPTEKLLSGRVKLLELDFNAPDTPKALQSLVEQWKPHGDLRGNGEFVVRLQEQPDIEASLSLSIRDLHMHGLRLVNQDRVSCHYKTGQGLRVDNVKGILGLSPETDGGIGLAIAHIFYTPNTQELRIEKAGFAIPAQRLSWLADSAAELYPDAVDTDLQTLFKKLKRDGDLAGLIYLSYSPEGPTVRVELESGDYYLFDHPYKLSQTAIEYSSFQTQLSTLYRLKGRDIGLRCQFATGNWKHAQAMLWERPEVPGELNPAEMLLVDWWADRDDGLQIGRLSGYFSGLRFDLARQAELADKDWLAFIGTVSGNPTEAAWLMPDAISEQVRRWKMRDGYSLTGSFVVDKTGSDAHHFAGHLTGEEFALYDAQLQSLFADVEANHERVRVKDLRIMDPRVQVQVPNVSADNIEDVWDIVVPSVLVTDMHPVKLWPPDKESRRGSLVVRKLRIGDLKGQTSDRRSFTGSMDLDFLNPEQVNKPNTIFVIPKEILLRIGLNPSALTPVTGQVVGDIRDGRVYFNAFKDVFSAGRASRFFLADKRGPSYMDLDGNLNIQVRMKQYNLLFKIAELFTISVVGDLTNPEYSLSRQDVAEESDEESEDS